MGREVEGRPSQYLEDWDTNGEGSTAVRCCGHTNREVRGRVWDDANVKIGVKADPNRHLGGPTGQVGQADVDAFDNAREVPGLLEGGEGGGHVVHMHVGSGEGRAQRGGRAGHDERIVKEVGDLTRHLGVLLACEGRNGGDNVALIFIITEDEGG